MGRASDQIILLGAAHGFVIDDLSEAAQPFHRAEVQYQASPAVGRHSLSTWTAAGRAELAHMVIKMLRLRGTVAGLVLFFVTAGLAIASEMQYVDNLNVNHVAALFPKNAQENVINNWPLVKAELKQYGLGGKRDLIVYALATIRVETGRFTPNPEQPSKHSKAVDRAGYAGIQDAGTERPFGAYDSSITYGRDGRPIINKQLGNCLYTGKDEMLMRERQGMPPRPKCDDGEKYRGRGFIQITGRYNYERMQKGLNGKIKVDLVNNPETAADPAIAAKILAIYLTERRAEIERAMAAKDYIEARKVVNTAALGMDVFLQVVKQTDRTFP